MSLGHYFHLLRVYLISIIVSISCFEYQFSSKFAFSFSNVSKFNFNRLSIYGSWIKASNCFNCDSLDWSLGLIDLSYFISLTAEAYLDTQCKNKKAMKVEKTKFPTNIRFFIGFNKVLIILLDNILKCIFLSLFYKSGSRKIHISFSFFKGLFPLHYFYWI